MRLALLLVLVVILTAGIRAPRSTTNTTDRLDLVFIGDTHWGNQPSIGGVGDGVLGRNRLRRMVEWSNATPEIDGWILGGDWEWGSNSTDATSRDSLIALISGTLKVETYPVIGNWEWTAADTGTGHLYDNFASRFPGYFAPYETPGKRGRRWYGTRLYTKDGGRTNVNLWVGQNNRDVPTGDGNYRVNNPNDGSGKSNTDFDGWALSASEQWADFLAWNDLVSSDDWKILAFHRTHHGGAGLSSGRPDVEGGTSADSSVVRWLDANDSNRFILLEADTHENKILGLVGKHYTLSACMKPRQIEADRVAAWEGTPQQFAYADTAYDASRGLGLVDSLGVDGGRIDYDGNGLTGAAGWNLFHRLTFLADTCDVRTYLVKQDSTVTLVDSLRFVR